MLLDANLLLYAINEESPHHAAASAWFTGLIAGDRRVALPWQTVTAFVRISTHPRIATNPLSGAQAWRHVASWMESGPMWIPPATERTAVLLGDLIERHRVTGDLITDASLAALAIEHGLVIYSADTDFARFDEVRWENPLLA